MEIYKNYVQLREKNIVLIGMPGCGKSTIGKILASKIGYKFEDLDDYIESISGKTIKELFLKGEENFRQWEQEAVTKIYDKTGMVIATGGGTIKSTFNMKLLMKRGIIIFIDRPIDNIMKDIDIRTRPLLKDGVEKLYDLYDERYNIYKAYSDVKINNSGTIKESIDEILKSIT